MLGGELAVLQAPMLDGLSLDPFTLLDDALRPAEVGEVGLPHLVRPAGPGVELIGGLDHDVVRAGDQVVGLEQLVNRGFRHEVALFVGEAHGQFAGAEVGRLQRHLDDLVLDVVADAVPHPARRRRFILQCFRPAFEVAVVPAVEGPAGDAELIQRALGRQAALARFHELLRPGVIQALRDAFLAAQFGDAVLAAQAFQHDPDRVFRREMTTGLPSNVLYHLLGRLLGT